MEEDGKINIIRSFYMKKVKWVIILLVIVCMFFLFELKVYASEDEIANIMKKIPDTIELNDSTEMTIEDKLAEISIPEEYELRILSRDNYWSTQVGLKLKNESASQYLATKVIRIERTCDLVEEILKIMPNEIKIDILEIEYSDDDYKKANNLIKNELNKYLEQKGISLNELKNKNIEIETYINPLYSEKRGKVCLYVY